MSASHILSPAEGYRTVSHEQIERAVDKVMRERSGEPIRSTVVHHDDASIEYVLSGPTEGSLLGPIERIKSSFLRSDVVVGRPVMVRGDVQVSVRVFR